ncbi:GSCOCG00002055001-RA-CDS [Cotesia congregata]|uniref:Protein kintoun n=1 Tax=Cotesia congregata TaxID=51543 RepID=A0A8J2MTL2_COTCN|nr:GSCOCG00002055001-RA-CDS [Cotesia congregata]CAG5108977.1 Similar to Nop17l: Protein kintoun (Drosophila yakuba) [Cotesia congregata]
MDACDIQKDNWNELEVTREEFDKLNECLKKDEFRKLFIEYAEEVSNPENRKLYQEEIKKLERERGVDVTFVNPEPGYVIKTSLNGDKKCFINISKNDCVGKPTSQPSYNADSGHRGLEWSIPHTLAPPRDDLDKKNSRCTVFDVVFNPDTLYLASKNPRFKDIVNNTALDSIEKNFKVKLDRKNLKFPKINFKGTSQSSVIRKECEKSSESTEESQEYEPEIYQKLITSYDEAREKYNKKVLAPEKQSRPIPTTKYFNNNKISNSEDVQYATPKFIIKHQTDLDLQDFRNAKNSKIYATIPKKLVIIIDLPLLRNAGDATLDVQERLLSLISEKPAKYRLELPLPYHVDPNHGNAKFDTSKKKLTVTLPVIRKVVKLSEVTRYDSGVESDHSPVISESSSIDTDDSKIHFDDLQTIVDNLEASNGLISEITSVDCDKINLNTTDHHKIKTTTDIESIINTNITYSLPHLNCNFYDDTIALVIDVKNVDADSIRYKFLNNNTTICIVLVSIGAGFFPVNYALFLKLDQGSSFDADTINVEPWDNNVIVSVVMKNAEKMTRYFVGLNQEFLEARDVPHRISFTKKYEAFLKTKDEELLAANKVGAQVDRPEDSEQVTNGRDNDDAGNHHHMDSDDEYSETGVNDKKKRECLKKCRSISESSGDELPDSSNKGTKSRGILKYGRGNFSRSVSESSIDDTTGLVSSIDFNYDSVQEHYSESDCCSLKKTVRFNDVVSRQLFRSNSSILGRRKKNQRKLRKKKQAHERRMSESENSETEDRDKYKANATNENNKGEKAVDNNVKSILNRDKLSNHKLSDQENNYNYNKSDNGLKSQVNDIDIKNLDLTEFKNDLIFDLDI